MRMNKEEDTMATVIIVPEGAAAARVELTYEGDVSLTITEPEPGIELATVVDNDGTEIVFVNPASYSFSEDE
jgi:hypothetical protein